MTRNVPADVLVLCYHGVSDRPTASTAVRPEAFARQLGSLRRRGYDGATFSAALATPQESRVVAITFDDAFPCVLGTALPIMRQHGFVGTVFVPTAYPGDARIAPWAGLRTDGDERTSMDWEELAELAELGWEIGSHARTHPHLTALDDAALAEELAGSRDDCEQRLGRPCLSLAYPYSDVDPRVVAATSAAGYRFAATVAHRPAWPLPLLWPRVEISAADSDRSFALRTSVAARRAQAAALAGRTGDAARRVKHALAGIGRRP
jgi:peptidoglycan/xylan/chitin deacetylase (PgdA/CDA1 family)